LRSVDIGSFKDLRYSAERVPTLAEALAACKGHCRVIVELKSYGHDQKLEERVVAIIEDAGMENDCMFRNHRGDISPHTAAHRFFDLFFGDQDRDRTCSKEAEQKDRNEIADHVPEGSPKKSGLRQKNCQIGRCRTHTRQRAGLFRATLNGGYVADAQISSR
jgi:hypothetical protein